MSSACVEDVVAAQQTVFTCPLNKVCRLTGIQIVILAGNVPNTITISDTFTPSVSNAVAVPVEVADQAKKIIHVAAAGQYSWADEIKSIKILGTCEVIGTDAVVGTDVTVMWEQD